MENNNEKNEFYTVGMTIDDRRTYQRYTYHHDVPSIIYLPDMTQIQ